MKLLLALALVLTACQTPTLSIPIPLTGPEPSQQYRLVIFATINVAPPPDFTLPHIDAPIALGLSK